MVIITIRYLYLLGYYTSQKSEIAFIIKINIYEERDSVMEKNNGLFIIVINVPWYKTERNLTRGGSYTVACV